MPGGDGHRVPLLSDEQRRVRDDFDAARAPHGQRSFHGRGIIVDEETGAPRYDATEGEAEINPAAGISAPPTVSPVTSAVRHSIYEQRLQGLAQDPWYAKLCGILLYGGLAGVAGTSYAYMSQMGMSSLFSPSGILHRFDSTILRTTMEVLCDTSSGISNAALYLYGLIFLPNEKASIDDQRRASQGRAPWSCDELTNRTYMLNVALVLVSLFFVAPPVLAATLAAETPIWIAIPLWLERAFLSYFSLHTGKKILQGFTKLWDSGTPWSEKIRLGTALLMGAAYILGQHADFSGAWIDGKLMGCESGSQVGMRFVDLLGVVGSFPFVAEFVNKGFHLKPETVPVDKDVCDSNEQDAIAWHWRFLAMATAALSVGGPLGLLAKARCSSDFGFEGCLKPVGAAAGVIINYGALCNLFKNVFKILASSSDQQSPPSSTDGATAPVDSAVTGNPKLDLEAAVGKTAKEEGAVDDTDVLDVPDFSSSSRAVGTGAATAERLDAMVYDLELGFSREAFGDFVDTVDVIINDPTTDGAPRAFAKAASSDCASSVGSVSVQDDGSSATASTTEPDDIACMKDVEFTPRQWAKQAQVAKQAQAFCPGVKVFEAPAVQGSVAINVTY